MRHLILGCALALGMAGCATDPTDTSCSHKIYFGLTVTVRDSLTNLPITKGATVVARDGAYQETLLAVFPLDGFFAGADERAGTYQITVTKTGYQTWVRNGVRVVRGVCHVTPVQVEALLQPE